MLREHYSVGAIYLVLLLLATRILALIVRYIDPIQVLIYQNIKREIYLRFSKPSRHVEND